MAQPRGLTSIKPEAVAGKARINLQRAAILLVDDALGLQILSQIFYGFGARTLHRCRTAAEALETLSSSAIDLALIEAELQDGDGYALVRAVRAGAAGDANRFAPMMVLSAHTVSTKVASARDCGSNFFLAKPVSPQVIMDRLLWVAREKRQYLQADTYVGPDRRFQNEPLPEGMGGRRREDHAPTIAATVEPLS